MGDSAAPVTIVELADLECPACRGFQSTIRNFLKAHPHAAAVVYVSFPLPMHRFAMGAAQGAECAQRRGRFRQWVDAIYDKQDSLGLKSWGSYAHDAGISDTAAIARCARNPSPATRIQEGVAYGRRIHVTGTPTVIVNGWRFPYSPSDVDLEAVLDSVAKGRIPFDTNAGAQRGR